jgi:hypothetical protein
VTVLYDAGALVALERNDRAMWRRLKGELVRGARPLTNGGIVAQVWRGGAGRQARLAHALAGIEVVALDDALGRRTGVLLGAARTSDALDASIVALAADGDRIVTSDPSDLQRLVDAAGREVDVIGI